jgi:hypothetical protein
MYQFYDYSARAFGVDLYFVDTVGTFPVVEAPDSSYGSLEDALEEIGDEDPIYVHGDGDDEALDVHKKWDFWSDSTLVIGPDHDGMEVPVGARSVRMSLPNGKMELWSHSVLCAVLYVASREVQ